MIYFSELKGKDVFTEDKIKIGKIEDLIFLASEKPNVSKLVVKDPTDKRLIIPTSFLKKIHNSILIGKEFETSELVENELYLVKNILDKQILDLQGNKIVRVNDVLLQDKDGFYISGVDTGLLGILRWLKLEKYFIKFSNYLHLNTSSSFLSWADIQPLELSRGQVKMRKDEKKLEKLRPEDLADYLEKTNVVNTNKILKMLDEKFAAEVIGNLNINFQTSLFKQFNPEKAAKIIELIDSDDSVDILLTISSKKRDQIIALLNSTKNKEILHLISLSKTPIGELISTEYFTVNPEETINDVINRIKIETADFSSLNSIYVLNKEKQLVGVFTPHELLLQDRDTPVYKFMIQNMIVIHLSTPVEISLKKMFKYKLATLPVVDSYKHILGVLTSDDAAKFMLNKLP